MYRNLNIENLEGEIWKDIEGYESLYQVSNMGRVKALNYNRSGKEKIMKQSFEKDGYLRVGLTKDRKIKTIKVHRLVATTFIENIGDKPCVDHKNTIRYDNRVENLRFVTHKENNNNELTKKHLSESRKGFCHTEETKEKLRAYTGKNTSNYKGFIALFPNGEVTKEMLGKELGELLRVSESVVVKLAKSGKPYKPFYKRLKNLEGIKIYYYQDYKKLVGDSNVS